MDTGYYIGEIETCAGDGKVGRGDGVEERSVQDLSGNATGSNQETNDVTATLIGRTGYTKN